MFRHVLLPNGNRGAVVLMMVFLTMGSNLPPLEAQVTTVTGVVKNASGQPVAGALVKVKSADLGFSFLVVSQAQGRYSTPNLLAGKYTAQGFGGVYQSGVSAPVEVTSGAQAKMDLVLSTERKPYVAEKRLTDDDYVKMMPEGEAKQLISTRCLLCHGLERVVPAREKPEDWRDHLDRMFGYVESRPDIQAKYHIGPFTEHERKMIFDYVTKNFGPNSPRIRREGSEEVGHGLVVVSDKSPERHLPRVLLNGAAAKFVAMEFDKVGRDGVHDIAPDSHGIAWVSEQTIGTGMIGRFDPKRLSYTHVAPPPANFPHFLGSLAIDPQDHVWLVDRGPKPNIKILQYNPANGAFKTYNIAAPPKYRAPFNTIRFLNGNLWGAGNSGSRIVKLEPDTGKITEYPVLKGSHPFGLGIGGDRKIWYVAMYDNEVVRLDPNTGKFTHYKPPLKHFGPRRMGVDRQGNLWAAGQDSGVLVKVDYRTGKMSEYEPPTKDSGPYIVDGDPTRNVIWFGESYAHQLGRYDIDTNSFAEFPLPTADVRPSSVKVDPTNPNRVWWAGSKIGYIEVIQ